MILLQSFGSGLAQLFFPIAIVAVAYFFILRPEQNKRKKQAEFISNLKSGDKIVTAGGIHGKIVGIEKNHFLMFNFNHTKISFNLKLHLKKEIMRVYLKFLKRTSRFQIQETTLF